MGQIILIAGIGVVAMSMGNYSIVNRFPRIDIKFTLRAVNALICKFKQRFFWHMMITRSMRIGFKQQIPAVPGSSLEVPSNPIAIGSTPAGETLLLGIYYS